MSEGPLAAAFGARAPTFVRGIGSAWLSRLNGWLAEAVAAESRASPAPASPTSLVRVAALYAGRGEAHVDHAAEHNDASPRDCLHYCVTGGVLDALALETLGAAVEVLAPREPERIATNP